MDEVDILRTSLSLTLEGYLQACELVRVCIMPRVDCRYMRGQIIPYPNPNSKVRTTICKPKIGYPAPPKEIRNKLYEAHLKPTQTSHPKI